MNKKEVEKRIGKKFEHEFEIFMRGQTVGINKDGTFDYYEQDVDKFCKIWGI